MANEPASPFNPAPWPVVDFAGFGEIERKSLSKIQKLTGDFLSRNWVRIPHVTHHDEADITSLEAKRRVYNHTDPEAKLTALPFLVKAVTAALQAFPQFNASLEPDQMTLVFKKYYHIGIAVDTPRGLLVGVIRDCDQKSVPELAAEIAAVSAKARDKGLSMAEMSGGCMSISSLGSLGGTAFTPIINAPEVAILGVSQTQERAVRSGEAISWARLMPLSMSYDHRVINGADAARFVNHIKASLADPQRLFEPFR